MTTATVETLTASVNVLQYGNRQITLSVAKQLDVVSPYSIEPMGRVRLGIKGRGDVSVIGRCGTGELATAEYPYPNNFHGKAELDIVGPVEILVDETRTKPVGLNGWRVSDSELMDPHGNVSLIYPAKLTNGRRYTEFIIEPNDLGNLHLDAIDRLNEMQNMRKKFDALPLIVLAGR